MGRKLAALVAVLALVGGACGDDDEDEGSAGTATTTAGATGPQTFEIGVDAKSDEVNAAWLHFFPAKLQARPGDTVEFRAAFTGEPHSVAVGTLIDEGLEAFAKFPEDGPPPPELEAIAGKVPFVFNEESSGTDDLFTQAGSQPCFLATEDPPTKEACPKEKQEAPEEFTGKERFLSSGFMADEDVFSLKLADDIAPGTYTFICLVHGPEMTEELTVVEKGADVPDADAVAAAGEKDLDEFVGKIEDAANEIKASTGVAAKGGLFPEVEDLPSAGVNVFPANIEAKVGEKVTWTIDGAHTIAFNAPEDARPWVKFDDAGALVVNEKAVLPQDSPAIPAPPEAAEGEGGDEEGPPPQLKVDAGTYAGQGFRNSGFPLSDGQLVYSMAFSKPGTYTYVCLVHPDMEGKVTVG